MFFIIIGHDHSSDEAEEADPKTEGTQCLSEILKESEHCFNVEAPPEAHAIESTDVSRYRVYSTST